MMMLSQISFLCFAAALYMYVEVPLRVMMFLRIIEAFLCTDGNE